MDMSMSMYATDIKPNRLTQARYKASDLLSLWKEGLTGMVAYAGDAYTISPWRQTSTPPWTSYPTYHQISCPFQGGNAASGQLKLAIEMMTSCSSIKAIWYWIADDIDGQEKKDIDSLPSIVIGRYQSWL